ncbi:MAG: biotin--[acetyl-CoA-carboxylase] ligase [Gemmatimonadota bacterium]
MRETTLHGRRPAYDGHGPESLAALLDVPRVLIRETTASTMDDAHAAAAAGAPAGTLVITDEQTAGRGRGGRSWLSEPGGSITMTLIERPADGEALGVLALRVGLAVAHSLQRFSTDSLSVKWPNDIMRSERKLAGVLCEARWRDQRPDWVAIGLGLNVRGPLGLADAASLDAGASRLQVLAEVLPALRAAAVARGLLSDRELERFTERDWCRGKVLAEPARGVARGITPRGELLIETDRSTIRCNTGSLSLA